jgi:hypothetical protein
MSAWQVDKPADKEPPVGLIDDAGDLWLSAQHGVICIQQNGNRFVRTDLTLDKVPHEYGARRFVESGSKVSLTV